MHSSDARPCRARRGRRRATATLILAVLASLALVVAGCGGDSDDNEANEAFASSVCGAVGTWTKEINGIVSSITIDNVSKASLQSKLSEAEAATKTLATQLKAVPPPDSPDGTAAEQQLDQLSKDVKSTITTGKSALAEVQDSASLATIKAALLLIAPQVKSLVSSAQSAVESLKSAGGSLSSAFKDTDSCQSLGGD